MASPAVAATIVKLETTLVAALVEMTMATEAIDFYTIEQNLFFLLFCLHL